MEIWQSSSWTRCSRHWRTPPGGRSWRASPKVTAEPGTPFLDTERVLDAPRDLVFRCWTEPELLAQWLGPKRLTMRVEEYDVRPGGRWRYVHVEEDGTEYGFHGVFHGDQSP